VDERCCPCVPPTIMDPIRAVPVGSDDFGAQCQAECGECQVEAMPITVVAHCVENQCKAVDLREQDFTACKDDSDCELRAISCCGWCGSVNVGNSYSVNTTAEFEPCMDAQPCPDIECPGDGVVAAEAFCDSNGHCFVREKG